MKLTSLGVIDIYPWNLQFMLDQKSNFIIFLKGINLANKNIYHQENEEREN